MQQLITNRNIDIQYIQINKDNDNDWFRLQPNPEGTKWTGKCWYYYNHVKYEFELVIDVRTAPGN